MDLNGMVVTALEGEKMGPSRVRLEFEEAPESNRYQMLVFRDGRCRRLEIPRIGERIELPRGFL